MLIDILKTTKNPNKLNIAAAQVILTRLTMPCVRKWMKTADKSFLENDLVDVIHHGTFASDTLGAAYKQWLADNDLPLNPISEKATRFEGDPLEQLFVSNLGMIHDLLHVTQGHDINTAGEAQIAAWTHGNLTDTGQRLLLWVYALRNPRMIRKLLTAYNKGRKAPTITHINWAKKVHEPVKR